MCFGNVNRSAFAENYMRAHLKPHDVEVRSAGQFERAGRPSTPQAKKTAALYNISLENHSSSILSHKLAEWADIIFVMDRINMQWLETHIPDARLKAHYLGSMVPGGPLQIGDPDQRPDQYFGIVFRQIASAIDALLKKH